MVSPKPTSQRLLDLGVASFFRPEPIDPPANQVNVKAGFAFSGGFEIHDRFTAGDQLSPGFSVVGVGNQRYDLVFIDNTGAVQVLVGTVVSAGTGAFEGAPGWNGGGTPGPDLPNNANPVAWVKITETATVIIDASDITQLNGFIRISNDLIGETIDKGFFGSAPAGLSDDVSALFAAEAPSNGTVRGVVTSAPLNYTRLLNQANDEILNDLAAGARVYGRLTEAAGTWTLSYFFIDAAGAEQTIDPSTLTPAPTDVRLVAVPKVFSINDPNRPLFDSQFARLSDQIAGDIPVGTETVKGKVQFAPDGGTNALEAVQGNDTRLANLGLPTPTNWGATTLVMSSDLVLTNSSDVWQILDPNGADRKVTMAAFSTSNRAHLIVNVGLNLIQVVDSAGTILWELLPDQAAKFIPDGTATWFVGAEKGFSKPIFGQSYVFGGIAGPPGPFYPAAGNGGQGGNRTTAITPGAHQVVHAAGEIDEVAWVTASPVVVNILQLHINEVAVGPRFYTPGGGDALAGGRGYHRLQTPISVAQGDRIAVESITNTAAGIHIQVRVRNTVGGYRLDFGNDITADNAFYRINGRSQDDTGGTVEGVGTTIVLVGTGNLVSVAYAIQGADAADSLDIVLNGVEDQVVTLTNGVVVSGILVGVETLTGSFSDGDRLAVRGNDAANMNDAHISIMTDVPGHAHQFLGNANAGQYYKVWMQLLTALGVADFTDPDVRAYSRRRGRIRVSWNTSVNPTLGLLVFVGANRSHTIDWTTGTQGTAKPPAVAEVGDDVALGSESGVEGQSNLLMVVS